MVYPVRPASSQHHEVDGRSLALPPSVGGSFDQVRLDIDYRLRLREP